VLRWFCTFVVAGVVTGFGMLLLSGRCDNAGPVVATLSDDHGVHLGDLFVIGGWIVAMLAVLVLAARSGRRRGY
jgi:hypothetical protein